MATTLFSSITKKDKEESIKKLIDDSTPRDHFFLMVILSVIMATFGFLINNTAVIIGSMLIAPLLLPVLGISLGVVMSDTSLISRSFLTIFKSIALSLPAAVLVGLLFSTQAGMDVSMNSEVLSRMEPSIIFASIAFIAGLAASFASIKPQLNASFPGVAISVALIPPLAVTGIGIARLDWHMVTSSFILFMINVASIIFASMIMFSLMNLYVKRPVADKAIKKEDAKLVKEIQHAEDEQDKTVV